MKFVRYSHNDGVIHSGFISGEYIHKSPADIPLIALLRSNNLEIQGAAALANPADISVSEATFHTPIETPPAVRDFMAFETHVVNSMAALGREVSPAWYEIPVFYFSNPQAVADPSSDVHISPGSEQYDFELEIAAIIGTSGTNIPLEDAEKHIAGYTIFCDWSARDLQELEMRVGLGPAKGKDGTSTLGPYFVSLDEIENLRSNKGYDIELTVKVNGKLYTKANWQTIYWSFAQMITFASRGTTLVPGDVIGSGTVGTGCILELGRVNGFDKFPYLRVGDVVEIDAGILGSTKNVIKKSVQVNPL